MSETLSPGAATAGRAPGRAPSNTPVLLRRLRAALIVLTILTAGSAAGLTFAVHVVNGTSEDRAATAVMQAYAVRADLADADSQAVETIPLGAGPSEQYQDDIAAAGQSLEQVAENNEAGETGTQALLLTQGLVTTYTGQVERADADYRTQGESGAALDYLWDASHGLLHVQVLPPGGGAVRTCPAPARGQSVRAQTEEASLQSLICAEQDALTAQRESPWLSRWMTGWLILPACLLVLLAVTQALLARRLRRLLSKWLALAAGAVIGLAVITAHVSWSEQQFGSALSGPYQRVITLQGTRAAATDSDGQGRLADLLAAQCPQCEAEQAQATRTKAGDSPYVPGRSEPGSAEGVSVQQDQFINDVRAATAYYLPFILGIAGFGLAIVVLIVLGLRDPLDSYRDRSS